MSFNLYAMLDESAAAAPTQPCVISANVTLTYREVDDHAARVAGNLLAQGLSPGTTVGVQLPNIPEFVVTYFGLMRAGMVMVPLNPLLRSAEILHQLRDSGAQLLITCDKTVDEAMGAARQLSGLKVTVVGNSASSLPAGVDSFSELLRPVPAPVIAVTNPDDTAVLLYTSGTTGRPKGAELTHFQLLMNCTVAGQLIGATRNDIAVGVLPLFHVFGLSSVLNASVRFGSTMVLLPRFTPELALETIQRHRATIFSGVPTMYVAMIAAANPDNDLSTLRIAISGGAALPGEVIRSFEDRFSSVTILEGYGLSETASTTTFNISAQERKVGSVGKAIWGVRVRVVDEGGHALPPGPDNIGEIAVQGHNVMKAYHQNPEATATAVRDGWLHTGDLGYLDVDGYLFVVDRLKDLIIRGGYNIYPREVEEVLYTHPDVVEAAVIGAPDETLGEEVVAAVSLVPDSGVSGDELIEFCRERMAAYKYPRRVRILADLPKGPTGKITKEPLRESQLASFALADQPPEESCEDA